MKSLGKNDLVRSLIQVIGVIRLVSSCLHHLMIFGCRLEAFMRILEGLHRKIFCRHTRNFDSIYQTSNSSSDLLTGERTKRIEPEHLQRVGDLKHFSFLQRIIDSYDDTFRVKALSASEILKMACQLNIPSTMSAFKVAVELLE